MEWRKNTKDDSLQIDKQIKRARLPTGGSVPFIPQLDKKQGRQANHQESDNPRWTEKGQEGYVDTKGKIWIRDRAHGKYPDHWDVQENGGKKGRTRVGDDGEIIP